MANNNSKKIGRTEVIELQDGTEVTLRPLNIKKLKEFMKKFGEIQKIEKNAEDFDSQFMDILVDMAAIAVSSQLKDTTAYLTDKDASREDWEEMVDQDTVAFINEVCGGISLGSSTDDDDEDFMKGIED